MTLEWSEHTAPIPLEATTKDNIEQTVYSAKVKESSDNSINVAIGLCIEKAVELLSNNIEDHSRYFLFEWNMSDSILTVVVTDDDKAHDSRLIVKCSFFGLNEAMQKALHASETLTEKSEDILEELHTNHIEKMKHEIRDYLTTCSGFMRYSLIAAFHSGNRNSCVLL